MLTIELITAIVAAALALWTCWMSRGLGRDE